MSASDVLSRYSTSGNIPILKSDFTKICDDVIQSQQDILAIEPTGVILDYIGTVAPTGWILASGGTIGDASSGATVLADPDAQDLFELLWNSMLDAQAPVSGGRGANASADFAANKTITIPDLRGRIVAGKGDMGGSTATTLNTVAHTTLGASVGSQTHTLVTGELPAHNHTASDAGHAHSASDSGHGHGVTDPTHQHTYDKPQSTINITAGGGSIALTAAYTTTFTALATTAGLSVNTGNASITVGSGNASITVGNTGSGTAHNNIQPSYILNKIIKL